jgi:CRISPR-associated protein Csh2
MDNKSLSSRHEFLFLYDIKMGNPNGDPDENRPRVLPDGTHYVTDVRLKRFARDFMKARGEEILVDNIEGKTTNLTGRVVDHLKKNDQMEANGEELVNILLDAFIDARFFGSSFAFKAEEVKGESSRKAEWKPVPKTMTGAVQLNMGEVLHKAEEVDIHGTSIFGSAQEKTQGTFTTYFGLRYALIGFSGVANEHSAKISRMSDDDYEYLLKAMWHGVRTSGNTRTKVGQIPHFLLDIKYKQGEEFQFGRLHDYVKMVATKDKEGTNGKKEKEWASPEDYELDLSLLIERLKGQNDRIETVRYAKSADIQFTEDLPSDWKTFDIESLPNEEATSGE